MTDGVIVCGCQEAPEKGCAAKVRQMEAVIDGELDLPFH